MDFNSVIVMLPSIVESALIVIGSSAVIVKALAEIAKITPTTKDDELASKAAVVLSYLSSFLDKVSLGLKANQSRPK